ncbi:hypothetical protein FRC04_005070 [Tulasnella sp. 424]|nr:hypothetical protein FRC04_005070 [Tulasnella sp. 424]
MFIPPPPIPPATSNQFPPVPMTDDSMQELSDRAKLTRSAVLTLLQVTWPACEMAALVWLTTSIPEDTNWPTQSEAAAQRLVQTINNLPNFPQDVTPVKDFVEEIIRVLEAARASLKEASDKYATKEIRGSWDGIKHAFSSLHRGKCTDILWTCRADIETVSTMLQSYLETSAPIGQQLAQTCRQSRTNTIPYDGGAKHAVVRHPQVAGVPVPIITEIGRIPKKNPKPPSSRDEQNNSKEAEVGVENPDEALDVETERTAVVIDYDTNQEMEKGMAEIAGNLLVGNLIGVFSSFAVIAQTASMLNPEKPPNATFAFQKVFADGDFAAAGVLVISVGGTKPSKSARDNTYVRSGITSLRCETPGLTQQL